MANSLKEKNKKNSRQFRLENPDYNAYQCYKYKQKKKLHATVLSYGEWKKFSEYERELKHKFKSR